MSTSASGPKAIRGTIKELNFAPKGEVDGVLIHADGGLTQVNLAPEQAGQVKGLVGRDVEMHVGPEPKVDDHPKGDHPVFKLVALVGDHPNATTHAEHKGAKPHHPHPETTEVAGTVARLNYAKHGEANGVVLDTGDFVHLKPDGMKKVGLKVGQQVTARGKGVPNELGGKAIDAEVVDGTELHGKK